LLEVKKGHGRNPPDENAISEELVKTGKKPEAGNYSDDEEDTVDEAPSIVDEVLAKDNTPTYGSEQSVASRFSNDFLWSTLLMTSQIILYFDHFKKRPIVTKVYLYPSPKSSHHKKLVLNRVSKF